MGEDNGKAGEMTRVVPEHEVRDRMHLDLNPGSTPHRPVNGLNLHFVS